MEKSEISQICRKFNITKYRINTDGSVDVNDNVNLKGKNLTEIPLKFGWVLGGFYISDNKLTSLKGAPFRVDDDFDCSANELKSLIDGPDIVGGRYHCGNNFLTDLHGSPRKINIDFSCFINKLTTLEGGPEEVSGEFFAYVNELTSLKGSPIKVGKDFYVAGNPSLVNLIGCPEEIGGNFTFDDTLVSLFSGDIDCHIKGKVKINPQENFNKTKLPDAVLRNEIHLKYVLLYQRFLDVWNPDLSLNQTNFQDLIEDIKDGLR